MSRLFSVLLILGAVVGSLLASGLVFAATIWLMPSLVARLLEREPGRPLTRAMTLCGLAAILKSLVALAGQGGSYDGIDRALDPAAVGLAWSAQATAWLLAELLPVLMVVRAEWIARQQVRQIEAARRDLDQEWS